MEIEQHIVDEVIRMHVQNGWELGIIAKLIRRRYEIEITSKEVRKITRKCNRHTIV